MKKFISLALVLILLPISSFAADVSITSTGGITVEVIPLETLKEREKPITVKRFLETAFNLLAQEEQIPETYKYISLDFIGVQKGTTLYSALQKGVYMNFIRNDKVKLPLEKAATEEMLADLVRRVSGTYVKYTKGRAISIDTVENTIHELYKANDVAPDSFSSDNHYPLVQDAFDRLQGEFYDADKVKSEDLVRGAVKGMTEATGDKYTVYFPPEDSKSFQDSLASEFEGIGAYMEMTANGIAKVVSPISGSPAEKAGLKGGDTISKIDDYVITDKDSITTVTSKIKGPAGTKVKLTVIRGSDTFTVEVVREKIAIHYVEFKKAGPDIAVVKISAFGAGVAKDFKETMAKAIKETGGADKLIIDLRNNPGGSLDEVAVILSSFVPE